MPLLSLNPNKIRDLVNHAPHRRRIFHFHAVTDATKPQPVHACNVLLQ